MFTFDKEKIAAKLLSQQFLGIYDHLRPLMSAATKLSIKPLL